MNLTQTEKRYVKMGYGAMVLVLYFLQASVLGVGLALPLAFIWVMWTLNTLNENLKRARPEILA